MRARRMRTARVRFPAASPDPRNLIGQTVTSHVDVARGAENSAPERAEKNRDARVAETKCA